MQCPHCNQEHPEGIPFCPTTGKKILMPEVCPECGTPVDPNWLYCSYCGRALTQAEGMSDQATGYSPAPVTPPGLSKTKTSSSKVRGLMIAGGIGGLLILAVIVSIAVGSGKNNGDAAPTAVAAPAGTPTLAAISAETSIATAIPCAGPPDASAQELAIQIQSRGGNNVAEGGVIIRSGEAVSFGPAGEVKGAGFWKSIDNLKYTVMFSDVKGKPFALTELQGDVQWDETACIVKGAESFIRMQIEPNIWLNIGKREVVQGRLVLTDEKGNKYAILSFDPSFNGVMAKQ